MKNVFTISEIMEANKNAGYHFFDKQTLHFFNSLILPTIYEGRFFITSEKDKYATNNVRKYTLREFLPEKSNIRTIGNYCEFETRRDAVSALKKHIKQQTNEGTKQ